MRSFLASATVLALGCATAEHRSEVQSRPALVVRPSVVTLASGESQAFTAFAGSTTGRVTWDIRNGKGEVITNAGTIDAQGVYRATGGLGKYFYIRATDADDPQRFATAMVEVVPLGQAATSRGGVKEDGEWLVLARASYRVNYRKGFEPDATVIADDIDLALAALTAEFRDHHPERILARTQCDVYLHAEPNDLASESMATLNSTFTGDGGYQASLHLFSPSAHRGPCVTNAGEGHDRVYFRKLLVHEMSTIFLECIGEGKGGGSAFGRAPSWFVQGYEEYLALNLSSEHSRTVTQEKYRDLLRKRPDRIAVGITVEDPYIDGAVLLAFLHARFGAERVQAVLKSEEPSFSAAVAKELGVDLPQLCAMCQEWLKE